MLFGLDLMSSNAASIAAGTLASLRALQQTAKVRQHGELVACPLAADSVEGLVGAKPINTGLVDLYHTQQSGLLLVCHEDNLAWLIMMEMRLACSTTQLAVQHAANCPPRSQQAQL